MNMNALNIANMMMPQQVFEKKKSKKNSQNNFLESNSQKLFLNKIS